MSPLIEPSGLAALLNTADLVIVCAGSGSSDRQRYQQQHLHNSRYLSLDADLSELGPDAAVGGRHPLPPVEKFAEVLGDNGIDPHSRVVVYDFNNGANSAARFWWMLRAVGHERVQVLNGGPEAAVEAGFPADNKPVQPESKPPYPAEKYNLPTATIDEVEKLLQQRKGVVIDVRSSDRFRGISEPIDPVAGHIPGAINIPLTQNLDQQGRFLKPEKLRELYQVTEGIPTVIHCGSGVTACHTILAMTAAGLPTPVLYTGSWSEWCRSGKPMATGEK